MSATFNLGAWRKAQLAEIHASPNWQGLTNRQRRIVEYVVLRRLSPDKGCIEKQSSIAARFGVSRQTLNEDLRAIEAAGILTARRF